MSDSEPARPAAGHLVSFVSLQVIGGLLHSDRWRWGDLPPTPLCVPRPVNLAIGACLEPQLALNQSSALVIVKHRGNLNVQDLVPVECPCMNRCRIITFADFSDFEERHSGCLGLKPFRCQEQHSNWALPNFSTYFFWWAILDFVC